METIFMNTLNSKICVYEFTDKLNLRNLNKNIALANLRIYYS